MILIHFLDTFMPSKNKIIRTTKSFDKSFQKIPKTVQDKTTKVLEIFYHDPVAPLLHNHALTGEWRGFRSINITGDYRLIFCEISE